MNEHHEHRDVTWRVVLHLTPSQTCLTSTSSVLDQLDAKFGIWEFQSSPAQLVERDQCQTQGSQGRQC